MRGGGVDQSLFFSQTLEYLTRYLPKQVGRSEKTVKSYRDALSIFRRWLLEERGVRISEFRFEDCDKALLMDFTGYLKDQGRAASSRNSRLAAIRSYVRFAADKDVALEPVSMSVNKAPFAKEPKIEREILTPSALTAMFAAPKQNEIGMRDRLILILLYDTAIRVAELTGIVVGEVSLSSASAQSIRIFGKGSKERVVALTRKTADHLALYMRHYHGDDPKLDDPLLYAGSSACKKPMSEANVERIVRKYAKIARMTCEEVPERVYPHMFRRTRATELYRNGVPLELVSRMLGHSSTETTKIYAKPSIEMLRAAIESVDSPIRSPEKPLWIGDEDNLAKICGLR